MPTTDEEKQAKLLKEAYAKMGMANPETNMPFDSAKYGRKDGVNAPAIPFNH